MRALANLKIKWKLMLGFGSIIFLTCIIAFFSLSQLSVVDKTYSGVLDSTISRSVSILNVSKNYSSYRRIAANAAAVYPGDSAALDKLEIEYKSIKANTDMQFETYFKSLENDSMVDETGKKARKELVGSLKSILDNEYQVVIDSIFDNARKNNLEESIKILKDAAGIATDITTLVDEILESAKNTRIVMTGEATKTAKTAEIFVMILLGATIIIAIICAISISGIISKGIVSIIDSAKRIANGDFSVSVGSNGKDEIAGLSNSLLNLKETIQSLVNDIQYLSGEAKAGDIDVRIDENAYKGEFRAVIKGINSTVEGFVGDVMNALETITAFSNGHFDIPIKEYPGKKALMTTSFKAVQASLRNFNSDIQNVINSASVGKLDVKINVDKYEGGWNVMGAGVNSLLIAIVTPIREAVSVLNQLSDGKLDNLVKGDYQGEFAVMKSSLNTTLKMLSSYIHEISEILEGLANDNLDQIVEREYVGEFSEIKNALNIIIDKFNHVVSDIVAAANQVASGAKQMSESSIVLAQGSVEQAASVEELNSTISIINENTKTNSQKALDAVDLSRHSKNHADRGSEYMNNLLISMDNIKDSSASISKIIKVIEDIAFQTNLLALNAAVEAARAGEHGKGFAVVAEEVRSLASRSQTSAKETAKLIEESMARVSEGASIAGQTAEAFGAIVKDASSISSIIENIADSSAEQKTSIEQMANGISQIAGVVQTNSATSQEAASASEELSAQSELLINTVKTFRLKK